MQLSPGTRLGPYEVSAPLGAGGMGEVYRARDTRLDRDVAIKALPPEFAQDTERLARFEREAKLLASLSHPNIAGIHGLEEVDGARYLVLEFVEGETLAERIERGALPVDDAVQVCAQVATAVEAAHEAGIIHRDLKPGNVMLKPDGTVKVLDFGLARADAGTTGDPNITSSPTMTHMATSAGMILGTAAYMSPEQARGKPIDRRTDIWSFGCVLYECLTGAQLFAGETVSDVIARILQTTPDWNALPDATPRRVRNLLMRCLERNPKQRLRDIGEARIALEDKSAEPQDAAAPAPAPRRRPSIALAAVLVAVTAIVSVVATRLTVQTPAPSDITLSVMLPRGEELYAGTENDVLAIAPDGSALVYAAQKDDGHRLLWRPLDQPVAVEIPGTDEARNPFVSPDGEWVGFFAGTHLYKVSIRGGTPIEITSAGLDRSATWLDDGTIVYSPTSSSPLYRIDADGGTPQAITTLDSTKNERTHRWPCALPGGEWIVYTVGLRDSPGGYDDAAIEAVSLETGERRELARGSCARYAPAPDAPGWLVVARRGSLYAVPIDPRDPRGDATPVPVLDGVIGVSTSGISFFDIARNGTLAVVPGAESTNEFSLSWIDLNGVVTPLDIAPQSFVQLSISPDGNRALAHIGPGGGNGDLFLLDLRSGNLTQITFNGRSGSGKWLPDGRAIVWVRSGPSGTEIVKRSLLGDEEPLVLTSTVGSLTINDVADDASAVYFHEFGRTDSDVLMVPTDGSGNVETVIAGPLAQGNMVLSPDERWCAYGSGETGRTEICVRPMGRRGGRVQVSSDGGWRPTWSADGSELYYSRGETMFATAMAVEGDVMLPDATRKLFDIPSGGTDSSERGFAFDPVTNRFLVRVPIGETSEMREISVRLNWAQSITP